MNAWLTDRLCAVSKRRPEPTHLNLQQGSGMTILAILVVFLVGLAPIGPGLAAPSAPQQLGHQFFLPYVMITNPAQRAPGSTIPAVPEFKAFATSVTDGQADVLKGVYAPGMFALEVVQQPEEDPVAVTSAAGRVTQFKAAQLFGVTGLLAHNHLAGKQFFQLAEGQIITLINGDGSSRDYQVRSAEPYQALSPTDPYTQLVYLPSGEVFTYDQVFARFYMDSGHLVFQTCIEKAGQPSWGRLFVVADPLD